MTARASLVALTGAAAALAVAAAPAGAAPPKVEQLVVFRDGSARQHSVKARATDVKVGSKGKECRVGSATPLAALALTEPPKLRIRDYGSCSDRARDAAGLFVRGIGGDNNKGTNGWVYKVRNRLATAGAGDPTGPFGHGRLEKGARLTWFYCHLDPDNGRCQKTLGVTAKPGEESTVQVHVTAYNDRGKRSAAGGATVHVGDYKQKADANGDANLVVPPGSYTVFAEKAGAVRSFGEPVKTG